MSEWFAAVARSYSSRGRPGQGAFATSQCFMVVHFKALLRKTMPVARRALGERADSMLRMRSIYAQSLYLDATGATLDDVRESVETLEDAERTARRVLGGAHPTTTAIERQLRGARAAYRSRTE